MPVTPVTEEAETGRIEIQGQLWQRSETPSQQKKLGMVVYT
jgi:hypothetical protein